MRRLLTERKKSISVKDSKGEQKEEELRYDTEKELLLRQISTLQSHIQLYHEEANSRREKYRKTIEDMLTEIETLKR
jgi:hypothetical protein